MEQHKPLLTTPQTFSSGKETKNVAIKRKLEEVKLDASSAKKLLVPISPDLGCCMDFSSPASDGDSLFTPFHSTPGLKLDFEQTDSGISSTPIDEVKEDRPYKKRCLAEGGEEEEEDWHIGAPLFESSACQSSGAADIRKPVKDNLISPGTCASDFTNETAHEGEGKLKVDTRNLHREPAPEPQKNPNVRRFQSVRRRSSIWDEMVWRQRKKQYLNSVNSHINESKRTTGGFVSELQNLMTNVSEQTRSNGRHWQHPSDLTRRNYREWCGNNSPTMSLSEWQAKNLPTHKRFQYVPKIFERSPS